jgi:hypothetical protein
LINIFENIILKLWIFLYSLSSPRNERQQALGGASKSCDSVADPGCSSRIPDPDFYPSRIPDLGSRIPDPKTATKERGEKKFDVKPFYVATKFN